MRVKYYTRLNDKILERGDKVIVTDSNSLYQGEIGTFWDVSSEFGYDLFLVIIGGVGIHFEEKHIQKFEGLAEAIYE